MQAQQGLPWRWLAFRDPVMLLAAALLLLPALPQSARGELDFPEAELEPGGQLPRPGLARALLLCVEWIHIFVLSTLAAVVFLGGNELPLLSIGAQSAWPLWQLLGVVVLELKCWTLVLLVVWLRWALPPISVEQLLAPVVRWVLPLSAATLGLSYALHEGASSAVFRSLQDSIGVITFSAAGFLLAYFVRRVLGRVLRGGPSPAVNPWL